MTRHVVHFSLLAVQNAPWQRTGLFGELPQKISWGGRTGSASPRVKMNGPSGRRSGPLGVCNPNEKQKPPPLPAIHWHWVVGESWEHILAFEMVAH